MQSVVYLLTLTSAWGSEISNTPDYKSSKLRGFEEPLQCTKTCDEIVSGLTCNWNVIAKRDIVGSQELEGAAWAGRDIFGWDQISFNYRDDPIPDNSRTTVLAGNKIFNSFNNTFKIPNGNVRSGSDDFPTILNQSSDAQALNIAGDPSITADYISSTLNDLNCLQEALCNLPANQEPRLVGEKTIFDTQSPDSGSDFTIYSIEWEDLFGTQPELEALHFDQVEGVLINIFGAPGQANWDWHMNGSFQNNVGKVLVNFCDLHGSLTVSKNFRAALMVKNATCDFQQVVDGGIYNCTDVNVPANEIHNPPFCVENIGHWVTCGTSTTTTTTTTTTTSTTTTTENTTTDVLIIPNFTPPTQSPYTTSTVEDDVDSNTVVYVLHLLL